LGLMAAAVAHSGLRKASTETKPRVGGPMHLDRPRAKGHNAINDAMFGNSGGGGGEDGDGKQEAAEEEDEDEEPVQATGNTDAGPLKESDFVPNRETRVGVYNPDQFKEVEDRAKGVGRVLDVWRDTAEVAVPNTVDRRALAKIDTVECLKLRQRDPYARCGPAVVAAAQATCADITIADFPGMASASCAAPGDRYRLPPQGQKNESKVEEATAALCDPCGMMGDRERQGAAKALVGAEALVKCGKKDKQRFQLGAIALKSFPDGTLDEESIHVFGNRVMELAGMVPKTGCASAGLLVLLPCHNIFQVVTPNCDFICKSRHGGLAEAAMRAVFEDIEIPPGWCSTEARVVSPKMNDLVGAAVTNGAHEVHRVLQRSGATAESVQRSERSYGQSLEFELSDEHKWKYIVQGMLGLLFLAILVGLWVAMVYHCVYSSAGQHLYSAALDPHQLRAQTVEVSLGEEKAKQQLLASLVPSADELRAKDYCEIGGTLVPRNAVLLPEAAMATLPMSIEGVSRIRVHPGCTVIFARRGRLPKRKLNLDFEGINLGDEVNQMGITNAGPRDIEREWSRHCALEARQQAARNEKEAIMADIQALGQP